MKDYRSDIQSRADIVEYDLDEKTMETLNLQVNRDVETGSHPFDALDMVYFQLKNLKDAKETTN